ncbi:hypothetical protein ABE10_02515, partial [Bacillus toyonensis]|nr:hypothetical protein [Bacillus toyonensis]
VPLVEHQRRAVPGGHHVLHEVGHVDLVPVAQRRRDRLLVGEVGEHVEVRVRVRERALAQREESVHVPLRDVLGGGIDIDGEVEEVAHGDVVRRRRRLQHVQSLDDHDVGTADHDMRVRDDVVAHVRIEGGAHLLGAALDPGEELQEGPPVVGLGEPLAFHEPSALELGVRIQEAVRRHQLHPRRSRPAAH